MKAMKIARQIIIGLSVFIGFWVGLSFIGVMFDIGNAEFWTVSLMWGLLASVIVMPGLVIVHHASRRAQARAEREDAREAVEQPAPFVDDAEEEGVLWPSDAEAKNRN